MHHSTSLDVPPFAQYLTVAVGLLLVFVATRYHNLAALPVFFDEAESIRISKMAWTGPHNWFLGAHLNRLLYIWWVAIFWPFTGALWISRAANLFVGLAGLAALLATGRLIGTRGAGLLAVALYITVPVAFFFDRIVLGEHMQMAISASLLFSTGVLLFHRRRWAVFVCGLLLTGYWLTKGTGFFWLGTPLLLLPTLPIRLWRSRLRWLAATYGVGAVSSLPFVLLLIRIGSDYGLSNEIEVMGVSGALGSGPGLVAEMAGRLSNHLLELWALLTSTYLPGLLMPVLTIGTALALWHHRRHSVGMLASIVIPLGVILTVLNRFEVRYLMPALPAVVLVAALGWVSAVASRPRFVLRGLPIMLVAAVLTTGPLQFMYSGWNSPLEMPLSTMPDERGEYLFEWSAGTGIPEVAAFIRAAAAERDTDLVVTDVGQLLFVSTYLGPEPNIRFTRDYTEQALRIKVLYEGLEDPFASLADPCRQVFLLAKSPQDDGRVAAITAPIKLIRSYERPVGGRAYDLYHVEPTDRALAIFAPDGCHGAGN